MLTFETLHTDPAQGAYLGSFARRGRLTLNHGVVETPIFMPVGTYGAVMAHTYLRRPLSPEVMIERGEWRVIRRRQTLGELLSLEE